MQSDHRLQQATQLTLFHPILCLVESCPPGGVISLVMEHPASGECVTLAVARGAQGIALSDKITEWAMQLATQYPQAQMIAEEAIADMEGLRARSVNQTP